MERKSKAKDLHDFLLYLVKIKYSKGRTSIKRMEVLRKRCELYAQTKVADMNLEINVSPPVVYQLTDGFTIEDRSNLRRLSFKVTFNFARFVPISIRRILQQYSNGEYIKHIYITYQQWSPNSAYIEVTI